MVKKNQAGCFRRSVVAALASLVLMSGCATSGSGAWYTYSGTIWKDGQAVRVTKRVYASSWQEGFEKAWPSP